MKVLYKVLKLFIPFFVLTGCFDSGDSFNPTDPDTVFTLFPSGYFNVGYSETYDLSGFGNNGISQLGLFSVETQLRTIFNGEPAIPVLTALQVTDTQTGSFSTAMKTEYFSIDSNDLRDLGFSNLLFGFTPFFAFSPAVIPATAKIGDSGEIGTYIDDFGTQNIIKTWQLEDGGDGRARLVYFSTTQDFRGFRLSSIEQRYLIEQNGDRISMSLKFFDADSILTLTLSGDKT
jgi:hypothetical protein